MDKFIFSYPTKSFGKNSAEQAFEKEHGRMGKTVMLAYGGGSVIDCCKVVSAQAQLSEDIWNMEYSRGQFPIAGIPIGAIVTASFAVLDPAYTMLVPPI